jgi:ribosomal protein L35AE/L33A
MPAAAAAFVSSSPPYSDRSFRIVIVRTHGESGFRAVITALQRPQLSYRHRAHSRRIRLARRHRRLTATAACAPSSPPYSDRSLRIVIVRTHGESGFRAVITAAAPPSIRSISVPTRPGSPVCGVLPALPLCRAGAAAARSFASALSSLNSFFHLLIPHIPLFTQKHKELVVKFQ